MNSRKKVTHMVKEDFMECSNSSNINRLGLYKVQYLKIMRQPICIKKAGQTVYKALRKRKIFENRTIIHLRGTGKIKAKS